ncbi:phospholipase D-like domain-containing protein [Thalassobacillus devorans]|uniref:phospholipase D-like domain-containing protein n=1 Tax=Thalassobacillus devorans TaxID=279813 RepID=UPI0004B568C7
MKRALPITVLIAMILSFYGPVLEDDHQAHAAVSGDVIINEVAWMGTTVSYSDEWLELYNPSSQDVDLTGWSLDAQDGTPAIALSGTIPAKSYYIIERTDDSTVSGVAANLIYYGSLSNSGEVLKLRDETGNIIDEVDAWHAGDNDTKATMERIDPDKSGINANNWANSTADYTEGLGTPKAANSSEGASGCADKTENISNVSEAEGAINVFFNKCADNQYATAGNEANDHVNLEDQLIERLNSATTSIDFATYEINLPRIVDTLIAKAAEGVKVRVIADAKDASDPHYTERYKTMRLYVEKMVRGRDETIGTADDIHVFSDSPMMAVEDSAARTEKGLPSEASDIPEVTVEIGNSTQTGRLFVEAEEKDTNAYYSPGNQMHNKFAVVDDRWVFTGSWNFTVTGLYGSEANMDAGILDGNQQHVVEINWPELAGIYETEFNEMWGSTGMTPDKVTSNYSSRKVDNTVHQVNINGVPVEIYFSAGDDAVGRMAELVKNEADLNTYFSIFAWSDQALVDELKYKWEGSYKDMQGSLTGFDIKGVFDTSFWNQWWSASVDMTGRTASQESTNNPNTRWANPAPVYQDEEARKLHSKTMLVDANTDSDPTVIVGSTNWSNNGNNVNDENMLFIHDAAITNQFLQEFHARYELAGGTMQ